MKHKLSYRFLLKYFPLLLLLVFFVVYKIAIKDTFMLRTQCNVMENDLLMAQSASLQIPQLKKRISELNNVSGSNNKILTSDILLDFISKSEFSKNISVVEFKPLHTYNSQKYLVETRVVEFAGVYKNLLAFLYQLEKKFEYGKLLSVKFETFDNLKTEKTELRMIVYIQSIHENASKSESNIKN